MKTCAGCNHNLTLKASWPRIYEAYCEVWEDFIDPDDRACHHYEPDSGDVLVAAEIARGLASGAIPLPEY